MCLFEETTTTYPPPITVQKEKHEKKITRRRAPHAVAVLLQQFFGPVHLVDGWVGASISTQIQSQDKQRRPDGVATLEGGDFVLRPDVWVNRIAQHKKGYNRWRS